MLSAIRKYIKSGKSSLIIWLLVIMFGGTSFLSIIGLLFQKKAPNIVATVNGSDIDINSFRRTYIPLAEQIQQIKRAYGDRARLLLQLYGIADKSPEHIALDELIKNKLLDTQAGYMDLHIDSDYVTHKLQDEQFVQSMLADIVPPQLFRHGKLDPYMLNQFLKQQHISEKDLEDQIKQKLKRYTFNLALYAGTYSSPQELKQQYIQQFSPKKFHVVSFEYEGYLQEAKKQPTSTEALQGFYKQHKERYRVPEQRTAQLYAFQPQSYGIIVPQADLRAYYNRHKNEFIQKPASFTVDRIVISTDVTDPEHAAKVHAKIRKHAHDFKQNPALFKTGVQALQQDLQDIAQVRYTTSTFSADDQNKELAFLEQAVQQLTDTQPISDVIKKKQGFEIIKLVHRQAPLFKPFDVVQSEIMHQIMQNKFNERFVADASRVINQAKDNPAILSKYVENKKAQVKQITLKKSDDSVAVEKLFSLTKQRPRGFYQQEGLGYIVVLDHIKPSYVQSFDEVRDQVKADYYQSRAQELLKQDVVKAQKVIAQDPAQAADGAYSKLDKTDWIDPEQPKTYGQLQAKGIEPRQILELTTIGKSVVQEGAQKSFIVALADIKPVNEQSFTQKKATLKQQMMAEESQELFASLLEALKTQADIDVNKSVLRLASKMRR